MTEPTEAQIDAASTVLWAETHPPYMARAENYLPPTGPGTPEQVARLRAADAEATAQNRDVVRRALKAALEA